MTKKKPAPTAARLRELLDYNPDSGVFRWKVDHYCVKAGDRAGGFNKSDGRWRVTVDRRTYPASRLAWLYMSGAWPFAEVDHRDVDPSNDAWDNLRLATSAQNKANTKARKDNKLGVKGVTYLSGPGRRKSFMARIRINGRQRTIGHYLTASEASEAYAKAANDAFGEFARTA